MDWFDDLREVALHAQTAGDMETKNAACLWQDGAMLMTTKAANSVPLGLGCGNGRMTRPLKYQFVEHAERSCIYKAARAGIRTVGTTMICTWGPCFACARAIICAGITRLVTLAPTAETAHPQWDEEIAKAMLMLAEAHVEVVYVDGPLDVKLRRNGELVTL